MARILGTLPAALIAAKGGMSANAFLRELQQLGIGVRRSEGLSLYKIARDIATHSPDEAYRDITQAPGESELLPYPTRKATGVRQVVTLLYRDRTTGAINRTYWSTTSQNGVIRETALATAVDKYAEQAERYKQDLIGAVHTGAYRYTPFFEQ